MMQHFKEFKNPSRENKVLLLVDENSSHKNIEVLQFARIIAYLYFAFLRIAPAVFNQFMHISTVLWKHIMIKLLQSGYKVPSKKGGFGIPGSTPTYTPNDISSVPSVTRSKLTRRRHEGSRVLTSTPNIDEIKTKLPEKKAVELRCSAKRAKKKISFQEDFDVEMANDDDDDEDTPCSRLMQDPRTDDRKLAVLTERQACRSSERKEWMW
ncbi:hypothetical protein PR048_003200 [Dryococelus australis]|uniref:DDE-1 domain-containing protein n=1 Tax=Dryococelus australis TaxID=614101 RepID=A0ABQ9IMX9_9NEOP|nr:hypothetical protein PR048_003200 [Dryococelus australis]